MGFTVRYDSSRNLTDTLKAQNDTMAPQQKKSGSGLMTYAVIGAASAGLYYFHKDMSQEELKQAGRSYLAKTKQVAQDGYQMLMGLFNKGAEAAPEEMDVSDAEEE